MRIRDLTADDWPAVEAIYADGIATGDATFESSPPTWGDFDHGKVDRPRLVAVDDPGAVIGWVAASPVSSRAVYVGVVEHSVYVASAARGRGVAGRLVEEFLRQAEGAGIWTVQSSVFPENLASLRVHEVAGFRVVGRRERIARMAHGPHEGEWRDTVLIEWRSPTSGRD